MDRWNKLLGSIVLCLSACASHAPDSAPLADLNVDPALKPYLLANPREDVRLVRPLIPQPGAGPLSKKDVAPDWRALYRPGQARPFVGLRVALDPGHMGGTFWDEQTGKYIVDSKGGRLSEGVLALEVALLVERELRDLGADVMLTRRTLDPVTTESFPNDPQRNAEYFLGPELEARAEKIRAFAPHLTLILHLDESTPGSDHNIDHLAERCNFTKAYVPGAFTADSLVSPPDREAFARLANDPTIWKQSVSLGRAITSNIHQRLDVPLDTGPHGAEQFAVEPGVYARNLRLPRRLPGLVVSYVEMLCYESPRDFRELQETLYPIQIAGRTERYSPRLRLLAQAVIAGILNFILDEASGVGGAR